MGANVGQSSGRPLLAKDARNGPPTGFLAGASASGLETWATRRDGHGPKGALVAGAEHPHGLRAVAAIVVEVKDRVANARMEGPEGHRDRAACLRRQKLAAVVGLGEVEGRVPAIDIDEVGEAHVLR